MTHFPREIGLVSAGAAVIVMMAAVVITPPSRFVVTGTRSKTSVSDQLSPSIGGLILSAFARNWRSCSVR